MTAQIITFEKPETPAATLKRCEAEFVAAWETFIDRSTAGDAVKVAYEEFERCRIALDEAWEAHAPPR